MRRSVAGSWLLPLLLLVAAVALCAGASASATPPPSGDWTIGPAEDAVLDGTFTQVTGNVTVQGTLSVLNGTLELASPLCPLPAELTVEAGAALRIDNATLRALSPCTFVIQAEPSATVTLANSTVSGVGTLSTSQVSGVGILLRGANATANGLSVVGAEGGIGLQEGARFSGRDLSLSVARRALYVAGGSSLSVANLTATGSLSSTDYLLIVEAASIGVVGGSLSGAPVAVLTLSAQADFDGVDIGPVGDVGVISLSSSLTWRGGDIAPFARGGFEAYGSVLDIETSFHNVTIGAVLTESTLRLSNSTFNSSGSNPKGSFAVVYARDSTADIVDSSFNGTFWVTTVTRIINGTPTDVPVFGCGTSSVWSVRSVVNVERTTTECFDTHYEMEDSVLTGNGMTLVNGTEGIRVVRGTIGIRDINGSLFIAPFSVLVTMFQTDGTIEGVVSRGNSVGVEFSDSRVRLDGLTYEGPGLGVRVVSGTPTVNGSTFHVHNETAVRLMAGAPVVSNSTFFLSADTLNATGVFVEGGTPLVEGNTFSGSLPMALTYGVWAWSESSPVVRGNQFLHLERAAVIYGHAFVLSGNTVDGCAQGFESREQSSGTISGNTFVNLTLLGAGNGVRIYFASTLVTGNLFDRVNYGVQVILITPSVPGDTRISGNSFSNVRWYAIQVLNSTRPVLIDNNSAHLTQEGAVELFRAPAVASYNLFFDIDGVGYSAIDTNLTVVGDRLENVTRGIETVNANVRVDYATFSRDAIGIFAQDSVLSVHNSSFQSNQIAMELPNGGMNEVHDSLFLANGDSILAFNSAEVDIRDTNFLRTLSFVVSCEQNATAHITYTRRGEITGGTVKLRGTLESDSTQLKLSGPRFLLSAFAGGRPAITIRGAEDLTMDSIDITNVTDPYEFSIENSTGALSDVRLTAPYAASSGAGGAPGFLGSALSMRHIEIVQAQGSLTFERTDASIDNLTVRNTNGSSLTVKGGSLQLADVALLDGSGCGVVGSAGAVLNGTNMTVRGHPAGSICGDNLTAALLASDLSSGAVDVDLAGASDVGLWSTRVTGSWTVAESAVLTIGWRVRVAVALSNPALITNVTVAASDSSGRRSTSHPNSTGSVNDLPYFPELRVNSTATVSFGPYVVSATLDPLSDSKSVALDRDLLVQLSLDDTVAPLLGISAPSEGQIFSTSNVSLSFTASDQGTGLRELSYRFGAGTPSKLDPSVGSHVLQRDLVDGAHSLVVRASDFSGNEAEVSVNFTVDTIAPLITVNLPRIQPFTTKDAEVIVQVGFDADVVLVKIGGEQAVIWKGTANRTIAIPEGTTTIEVQATDNAGNTGRSNVTVTSDRTPPPLDISNRQDSNVTIESFVVVRGTTEPGAIVLVQGVPVQTSNGSFEALVSLAVGKNRIDIRSTDALGNENATSIEVTRGVLKPSDILDIALTVLGVAMLGVGGFLLVRTMRREYDNTALERRKRRFERGGRP